ncbi:hypothetical protein HEK616_75790 (plasmid) [Streptomyces nigrescens]|uniref:Uncharacterized protein n=2 Tax=Streptomyces TaxID=1883 RepID=A0ABN6R6Q8_STRNI|nr:hypothetical protein [Streptomyces nigrescens]MEE4419183.1 hypothetical protein [Streptomyces sp. DSM 41528]BDM74092.1 hypothetical protein HEK616_75790 [Streptomyces nigrescens]
MTAESLSRLTSRVAHFVLHGRRPRLDHPDSHRAARSNQHAGLIHHYRPSSPTGGGGLQGPL